MSKDAPQSSQPLPAKEQTLFKQVVKLYENKQYKKAIKTADQILKKFPEHGETLAMKGLTLYHSSTDKKEEAYELVRKGLKYDLKSHVSWHVYGLLYRGDREYREAIKCYLNALRIDKDNVQILRDLANLQVQRRDLPGYVETRHQLLGLKASNRLHWVSLAVAHHINKSYDVAVQVLESYEKTLDEVPASEAYEHSEMLMYKAQVLSEGGRAQDALGVLDGNKDKIRDRVAWQQMRAELLLKLGRADESEAEYRALLDSNPDHYRMHEGLQAALGLRASPGQQLSSEQRAALSKLYSELQQQYPHSSACKRVPLDFKVGQDFVDALDDYVRKYLRKGIPSLFMDLRPLYKDSAKVSAVQELFERYNSELQAHGKFPPLKGQDAAPESPQTRVWVLYYLAQHYDRLQLVDKALAVIDEALSHTPTLVELYTVKAKVIKHAGDLDAAAHMAETARRMDLSDRFLNSVAVKALLRAGKAVAADKTASLFTKEAEPVASTLYDMQHMWYEVAAGSCHLRLKEYGKALKKYTAVIKHFADIQEDQFDFHSYCMRKMTLRAYVAMLRMEDTIYSHDFYSKAALGAVSCYLALHDRPAASYQVQDEEALLASMSAEERKKYKLKKKKEEKAKQKEAEEAAAAAAAAAKASAAAADGKKKGAAASTKEKDPDPDGAKLAAVEDPLAEATKLVVMLKEHAGGRLTTHTAAFQVYIRKGRLLLALSAVQRAAAIAGAAHPEVHKALVRFALKAEASPPDQPAVSQVVKEGLAALLGSKSAKAYHESWLSTHGSSSLAHRLAGAECSVLVDDKSREQGVKLVLGTPFRSAGAAGAAPLDHEECVAAHTALLPGGVLADAAAADKWRAACAAEFPQSTYFEGGKRLQYEQYDFDTMVDAFGRLSF
mmetsp:Transcript_486/g.1020  ORF Transcript_486/g.1020 Transcript_486/m.1020 type:complete len:894 (-) Transcript_486:3118-5799(-)